MGLRVEGSVFVFCGVGSGRGFKVWGLGFGVWYRVEDLGCRVWFRVETFGVKGLVQDQGSGPGFRVWPHPCLLLSFAPLPSCHLLRVEG